MKDNMTHYIFIGWKRKMYSLLLAVFLLISPSVIFAQSNASHLMVGGGISYKNGMEVTVSYEHTSDYHGSWEYFANGYLQYAKDPKYNRITKRSFWHNYRTWLLGIAYKPCVIRGRNNHGNFRIGVMAGSDTEKFIGGGTFGYEHSYALRHDWEVFFQVKEDVVARGEDIFRTGVSVGVKIPLN